MFQILGIFLLCNYEFYVSKMKDVSKTKSNFMTFSNKTTQFKNKAFEMENITQLPNNHYWYNYNNFISL